MFLDIVLRQFEILMNTPKAFAIPSPGVRASREPWGIILNCDETLKGLDGWRTLSGFHDYLMFGSQGCRGRSNPGLGIANAFGVISN
jgi:hypothetical protein